MALGISKLDEKKDIELVHLAWGNDFTNPTCTANITKEDKTILYSRVIPRIRNNINNEIAVVKAQNRAISIYDTFIDHDKSNVDKCIMSLPMSYIELIKKPMHEKIKPLLSPLCKSFIYLSSLYTDKGCYFQRQYTKFFGRLPSE